MCWAVFCELLRVFAAVFNFKKYWNTVEVPMGSKKKKKKLLWNVTTLNKLVPGSQTGKDFQNQWIVFRN